MFVLYSDPLVSSSSPYPPLTQFFNAMVELSLKRSASGAVLFNHHWFKQFGHVILLLVKTNAANMGSYFTAISTWIWNAGSGVSRRHYHQVLTLFQEVLSCIESVTVAKLEATILHQKVLTRSVGTDSAAKDSGTELAPYLVWLQLSREPGAITLIAIAPSLLL